MHWVLIVLLVTGAVLITGMVVVIRHFRATMRAHAALRALEVKRQEEGRRHAEARYTLDMLRAAIDAAGAAGPPDPAILERLGVLREVLERAEEPVRAVFPVSGPCAEVIDSFREIAGERDLLYSESGDGRWLQVEGDRALLKWAVDEIFRNVLEHAESWTRITVKAEPVDGSILLTIRDDGCGLDRPATSRIYTAFSPRLGSKGPGVGLFVVRHIVEGFGGRAEARSAPGGGVLHSLWLPHPEAGPYGPAAAGRVARP